MFDSQDTPLNMLLDKLLFFCLAIMANNKYYYKTKIISLICIRSYIDKSLFIFSLYIGVFTGGGALRIMSNKKLCLYYIIIYLYV